MSNQIGFSNAMKEVTGNNFITLDQLKNDNEIYFPLFKNKSNGTEAKKILGKLLANNGGGGSSDYAQPENVIVINYDVDEVEGKVYNSFGNAKVYIESLNTTEKFCIELPAGNFPEPITLDEKWLIHGNNTILTSPVYSNVVLGQNFTVNPSGVFISDCTVAGGFAGYHMETEADFVYFPVYKLNHCRITEFCSDSATEDLFFCLCEYCEIETTRSHNELIAKGTPGSVPYIVMTINSTILQFGASAISRIYCFYTDVRNVGAYTAIFIGCGQTGKFMEELPEINADELIMTNCYFQAIKSNNNDMSIFRVYDSKISVAMEGEININEFSANNSYVGLRSNEGATITINESWVSPDTVCDVNRNVTWSATSDHTMCYIMYSTDGGHTMSYDGTGATHYGILKTLPSENGYRTDYYMWFPMPN